MVYDFLKSLIITHISEFLDWELHGLYQDASLIKKRKKKRLYYTKIQFVLRDTQFVVSQIQRNVYTMVNGFKW